MNMEKHILVSFYDVLYKNFMSPNLRKTSVYKNLTWTVLYLYHVFASKKKSYFMITIYCDAGESYDDW